MMKAVLITLALLLLPWCLRADSDTLRPVAVGDVWGWTDGTWEDVDDVTADDGTTTTLTTNAPDDTMLVKLDTITIAASHGIDSVVFFTRSRRSGLAETVKNTPLLERSSSWLDGTEFELPLSYTDHEEALSRPGGGDWVPGDFADTLQMGLVHTYETGGNPYCTQLYLVVWHTDTTATGAQIIMVK
jgi:hypothetical protein